MSDFVKKKKYGQNFLTSDRIPARIAAESGITSECGVIEIGPGLGVLTKQHLSVAKKVVAIEIDEELIPILNEKFAQHDNFLLINKDILEIDLGKLIEEQFAGMPVCVCANLPYYPHPYEAFGRQARFPYNYRNGAKRGCAKIVQQMRRQRIRCNHRFCKLLFICKKAVSCKSRQFFSPAEG